MSKRRRPLTQDEKFQKIFREMILNWPPKEKK